MCWTSVASICLYYGVDQEGEWKRPANSVQQDGESHCSSAPAVCLNNCGCGATIMMPFSASQWATHQGPPDTAINAYIPIAQCVMEMLRHRDQRSIGVPINSYDTGDIVSNGNGEISAQNLLSSPSRPVGKDGSSYRDDVGLVSDTNPAQAKIDLIEGSRVPPTTRQRPTSRHALGPSKGIEEQSEFEVNNHKGLERRVVSIRSKDEMSYPQSSLRVFPADESSPTKLSPLPSPTSRSSVWSARGSFSFEDWCAPIITSSVKHRLSSVDPFASTEAFNNTPQSAPWLALERRLGNVLASKELNQAVNHLIDAIAPNRRDHRRRQRVVEEVQRVLHSNLGAKLFVHGSFAFRTYLPDANINLSAFFTRNHDKTWLQRVIRALANDPLDSIDDSASSGLGLNSATFLTALDSTRSINITVRGVSLEIGSNQGRSMATNALLEDVAKRIGKNHLFKRTILLCKLVFAHEICITSLLPASAMRALVLYVFAAADAAEIVEPLQGVLRVLTLLNDITSTHCALTPFARLPLLADSSQLHISTVSSCPPRSYLSLDMLARYSHHYRLQPGTVETEDVMESEEKRPAREQVSESKHLNIMDPLNTAINLTKNVSMAEAQYIHASISSILNQFESSLDAFATQTSDDSSISARQTLRKLFANSLTRYAELLSSPAASGNGDRVFDADPAQLLESIQHAGKFEMPKYNEAELVALMCDILLANGGAVTVGKMGSLMHNATNNHSLPAMIKTRFGGLKKLLRRHENVFFIASDHPHNPHVSLRPDAPVHSGKRPLRSSPLLSSGASSPVRRPYLRVDPHAASTADLSWSLKSLDLMSPSLSKTTSDDAESLLTKPSLSLHSLSSVRLGSGGDGSDGDDKLECVGAGDGNELWGREVPPEFHCPLSGRVMSQPVVTSDGRTFEKSALESWIRRNGNTSPLTGQKLPGDRQLSFVPNVSLKNLIDEFVTGS